MKELIPKDEYGIFADAHDIARVDSLYVADFFEKEHKNVLRDIDAILSPNSGFSPEFGQLNFEPTSYIDQWKRKQRCYAITRDGFTALAMGFTGKRQLSSRNSTLSVSTRWKNSSSRWYRQDRSFRFLPKTSSCSMTSRSLTTSATSAIC